MHGLGLVTLVSRALAVEGFTKGRIMQVITAQPEAIQSCALNLIIAIYNAPRATRIYQGI